MEYDVTLSKKEKRHYFLYLLGILFLAVIIISGVFLYRMDSPFTNSQESEVSIQSLQEKAKFEERQKLYLPVLDSAFAKIEKIGLEDQYSVAANTAETGINDIRNAFENTNITDPRKESYRQIALFYKMFLNDKQMATKKTENIETYNKKFEECTIYYREKRQQK